jgi:glucan phosphoethanolaminetransferase (alkaline phosphatase superfamily)
MAWERAEVAATVMIDGVLLLLVVGLRAILLWPLHWFGPAETMAWSVRLVEILLDFGLVGTVIVMTVFDFAKRMRNAYHSWRKDDDQR